MKTRGAAIQGGLAAVGLLLAYGTWQREPEKAPGEATVLDVSKGDIEKVRFEEGAKWVEIDQKPGEDGPAAWMRVSAKPSPQPAPERYVRGGAGAEKLFEKLAPLRATRALGVLDAAKLKELTLDAPKKKLTIVARGATRVFDVGAPTGVSDPYVKDQKDGRVYVLGGGIISDLDSAAVRLVDRRLHSFNAGDWNGLTLTVGAKKREWTVQGEKPTEQKLLSKKSQKPDAEAKNWHDKAFRLVVTEVLGQGEKPAAGDPQPVLKLEYGDHGKPRGWLEIGRTAPGAPPANTSMPAQNGDLYARSERTAGWMKLAANAEDIVKEADKVAGAAE
jgi:Domain of unknown function (DUF4340)